jgi:hypothetical protein
MSNSLKKKKKSIFMPLIDSLTNSHFLHGVGAAK